MSTPVVKSEPIENNITKPIENNMGEADSLDNYRIEPKNDKVLMNIITGLIFRIVSCHQQLIVLRITNTINDRFILSGYNTTKQGHKYVRDEDPENKLLFRGPEEKQRQWDSSGKFSIPAKSKLEIRIQTERRRTLNRQDVFHLIISKDGEHILETAVEYSGVGDVSDKTKHRFALYRPNSSTIRVKAMNITTDLKEDDDEKDDTVSVSSDTSNVSNVSTGINANNTIASRKRAHEDSIRNDESKITKLKANIIQLEEGIRIKRNKIEVLDKFAAKEDTKELFDALN